MDAIAKDKVWTEAIQRELRYLRPVEEFSVNPHRLSAYTDKPNARPKRFLKSSLEKMSEEERERLKETFNPSKPRTLETALLPENEFSSAFQSRDLPPTAKYDKPMSTLQELGWSSVPLMPKTELNYHPKSQCDVTKFAGELAKAGVLGKPSGGSPSKVAVASAKK